MKNINDSDKELLNNLGLVMQLGLVMAINIVGLFLLGFYLDRKFHTKGILLIIGILFGVVSGAISCYNLIKHNESKRTKSE
ncbi:MAG: hypothetical protein DRH57_05760 [Candidatus Cloacimonadota bacterium]|nr:MAG: hypothetical protein DRH57_05760 [Candidatus Cloacimonadota bacterium]